MDKPKQHADMKVSVNKIIQPKENRLIFRHGQDSRSCLGLARLASLGLDHETETTLVKTTRLTCYVSKVSEVN